MNTASIYKGVILAVLIASFGFIAHAQTPAPPAQGITFPIHELGDCASKDACRQYCDEAAHMEACVAFAETHGLMNKNDIATAKKYKTEIEAGRTPGGCASPGACRTYCGEAIHAEECVKFAESQGVNNPTIDAGRKLVAFMKGGGTLPGNCTSHQTCQKYCKEFIHLEECVVVAVKAGMGQYIQGIPSLTQLKTFLETVKKGETPGGCGTKEECREYCKDPAHAEACLVFSEKMGLVSASTAKKLRESNFKGPGGCASPEACKTYCNEHQDECVKFAEERGLVSQEKLTAIKDAMTRIRAGLQGASEEVKRCISASIGETELQNIEKGTAVPGPEFGGKVKACFERFGQKSDASEAFRKISGAVAACAKEKLGAAFDKIASGAEKPSPEAADMIRVCVDQTTLKVKEGLGGAVLKGIFDRVPAEVAMCLKTALGPDADKIAGGIVVPDAATKAKIAICLEQYKPKPTSSTSRDPAILERSQPMDIPNPPIETVLRNLPLSVVSCIKERFGANALAGIQTADQFRQKFGPCLEIRKPPVPEGEVTAPLNLNTPPPSSGGSFTPPPPPIVHTVCGEGDCVEVPADDGSPG